MYASLKDFSDCYGGWLRGRYVPFRDQSEAWLAEHRAALAAAGIPEPPALPKPPKHPLEVIL